MAEAHIPPFFIETIVVLSAAVIAVPITKRIGLGAVVGFLAAGVAIGPYGIGFFNEPERILGFAELGVVLLLFVIGLELEPARLWIMRRDIFGLGTAQVLISGFVLTLCAMLFGMTWQVALIAGLGLALSSTAFALQMLQERGHLSTKYGQRAFGILLLQDIAIVPLLAMVSILAPADADVQGTSIAIQVVTVIAAVGFVIFAGRYLLSPLFRLLTASGGRELMIAAALLVALGSAGLMSLVGLSMALGAFLSGVMLAESSYRHTLEADIEPFRSMLMGLFFMTVGMELELDLIVANWQRVVVAVVVLMLAKGVLLWGLSRLFGSSNSDALRVAVTLPQGGEFAFVLFATATAASILPQETANILSAVVILTMLLTPLGAVGLDFIAERMKKRGDTSNKIESFEDACPSVLIIGFGRFGQTASQMLISEGVSVTALDNNPERIKRAQQYGYKVYYGDATRPDVLKAAGGDNATLIALCIENDQVMKQAILQIRSAFPNAALYCRATDRAHALDLTRLGVDYQIRETFESSLTFGRKALEYLGLPADRIDEVESDVRKRDDERLAMQLAGGEMAGSDMLLQRTPRDKDKPDNPD
ncbi:potassium efflux system protein [Pseudovibrio japonicus]|uniref:Potassium efflux system protein n=1 Tax=Pseudovibrio japonicus TaxID=366534 RepID=A0ABQ3E0E4_9HYPH|nr:monovalent cation:proton antiporter-2 (CPA2) family protein [Pseudovibrio japonicus]GHB22042.1 potassium efflux system protein [Pseudovibrio japonicus]